MNFFKNILKTIKDQIKWGNRNPMTEPKIGTITIKTITPAPYVETPTNYIRKKGPSNSMFKGRRTPEQNRKRHLRRISGDSRRANIQMGFQGAH